MRGGQGKIEKGIKKRERLEEKRDRRFREGITKGGTKYRTAEG